jgi:tRNA threonylcarbamoyladenosine biosynthesis protein TsaB
VTGTWLALETATPHAAVVVVREGVAVAGRTLEHTRQHAESLAQAIDDTLAEAGLTAPQLAGVVVGEGPGSFVGVRVGIAHAKGVATALGVPLVGVCTLTALACGEGPAGEGYAMLDARRGEVYARRVVREQGLARAVADTLVLSPAEATERAQGGAFVIGNAGDLLGEVGAPSIARAGPTLVGLAAAAGARVAQDYRDERLDLVPRYGRAPDARLPAG